MLRIGGEVDTQITCSRWMLSQMGLRHPADELVEGTPTLDLSDKEVTSLF